MRQALLVYNWIHWIIPNLQNLLKKPQTWQKTITMYSPTTVSIGPIRTQKGGGVRKVRKRKTKQRRKGRQSTKLKINVKRLIKQILSAK